jgi:hypothetical protein
MPLKFWGKKKKRPGLGFPAEERLLPEITRPEGLPPLPTTPPPSVPRRRPPLPPPPAVERPSEYGLPPFPRPEPIPMPPPRPAVPVPEKIPPTPTAPPEKPKIERPKIEPIKPRMYVRVSKYREVMDSIKKLRNSMDNLKRKIAELSDIEKREDEKIKACEEISRKIEDLISFFERTFVQPEE